MKANMTNTTRSTGPTLGPGQPALQADAGRPDHHALGVFAGVLLYHVRSHEARTDVGTKKDKRKAETAKRPKRSSSMERERSTPRAEPASRREPRFTTIVPVRFEPTMLEAVRARAAADDRSVSAWIRRTVEAELGRGGAAPRGHFAGEDAR
jgi:hypothetical protein